MPRVKTIRPGRLSGISGLAKEAAQGVKYNKDVEYAYELEKWKEQNEKILEVQKQEQDTISENLKLIAGKELGVDDFNESVRNQMMDLAVKTARANSKMKLGDLDPMEGAKEVASYENVLDVFQTSIPNIAALSDRIINAPKSGADSILLPADPTQAEQVKNIVQIVTDMNSPERNSKVEYSVVGGKSMIKHKETGQEISLKGLNDIMSGKNPQYPIKFVPDFTQAAKSVVETMLEERKENFTKQVDVTTYDDDGTKRTVKKNKILTGDGSNYNTELTAAMDLMMNDKENMPGYWADLTKDLPVNDQTPWLNTDEQRKEAISLMYTAADNAWGPKTNVETTSETTVQQKPSSDSEDDDDKGKVKLVSYDTIINDATAFEKALKNPNRVISTGEAVKSEDIESGKVARLSKTEVELKGKLTDDLKSRFEGSSFATGSGTKIIQDIKIKYKDGKLLFFPQVNYAAAGNDEDLKTLKEYSSGVPLTNERLLKFEKQLKQIAKDSVVSTGVGANFNK